MIPREDLVSYVANVHARTHEAVDRLADAHLHWRPAPGEFSVAELVTHIASARLMNAAAVETGITRYPGHRVKDTATALALRRLMRRTSRQAIATISAADLERIIPNLAGPAFPAWRRVLGGLIEHETHHRSQLCAYLAALQLEPPPLFGLHVEDLPR